MEETVTESSIYTAISGEFNAVRMYRLFAEKAEEEGFRNVAYLFRAIIAGEEVHLKNHRRCIVIAGLDKYSPPEKEIKVGSTLDNLKTALEAELYEHRKLYPSLIKKAEKEFRNIDKLDKDTVKLSFRWAGAVEKTHAEVLKWAISYVSRGKDIEDVKFWVCRACGNLFIGDNPTEICPVCRHDPYFYTYVPRGGEKRDE